LLHELKEDFSEFLKERAPKGGAPPKGTWSASRSTLKKRESVCMLLWKLINKGDTDGIYFVTFVFF